MLDGIKELIIFGEKLINFILGSVNFLRCIKKFPLFQANLVPEDCNLVFESLDVVLLLSVVNVKALSQNSYLLPQFILSEFHGIEIIQQSGISFPGVGCFTLAIQKLSLEPLCIVVVFIVLALIDILKLVNLALLVGNFKVQLMDLSQQPPLVLLVQSLLVA